MGIVGKQVSISFVKALIVTCFFVLTHLFYNTEWVRNKIEDIGFDITSKILFEQFSKKTDSPKVMLFAFDDTYMTNEHLFNDDNKTNYGYMFPRDKIAHFIDSIDVLSQEIDPKNHPKALFIDYDFTYTSLPYGNQLSHEDKVLLETLKHERPYVIILPKNDDKNFIETCDDPHIQALIAQNKIIFASVNFLISSDGMTRRYQAYESYKKGNETLVYPNISLVLQQLAQQDYEKNALIPNFKKDDIIANRIIPRTYHDAIVEETCKSTQSYWTQFTMYSASCSPFDIIEEDFSNALLMLGGTYSNNPDTFSILKVGSSQSIQGVELHANTLMSLLYLQGQFKQIGLFISIVLVFFIYFMVDLCVSMLFKMNVLAPYEENFSQTTLLVMLTGMMFAFSAYLIFYQTVWFNWFVPVVLFQLYEMLKKKYLKLVEWFNKVCDALKYLKQKIN